MNHPGIISYLPEQLKIKDHNTVVTYKLRNIIRNKSLNYKESVESKYSLKSGNVL